MFRINLAESQKYCDGLSRRSFLALGTLGVGGLTLADLYRAEAAGPGSSHKAVINIHLGGGPSHQDMWDLKPDAPAEYRGEFNPIQTNVPGMDICEHFPLQAKIADKFSLVRSLHHDVGIHSDGGIVALTGKRPSKLDPTYSRGHYIVAGFRNGAEM